MSDKDYLRSLHSMLRLSVPDRWIINHNQKRERQCWNLQQGKSGHPTHKPGTSLFSLELYLLIMTQHRSRLYCVFNRLYTRIALSEEDVIEPPVL
jgi:hypothetical protein